jgi:hypothetical protein
MTSYNVNTLIEAVNEYLYSEEEMKRFLKTWVPGWWESKTPKQRDDTPSTKSATGRNTTPSTCSAS